jgi:hypothetical protein
MKIGSRALLRLALQRKASAGICAGSALLVPTLHCDALNFEAGAEEQRTGPDERACGKWRAEIGAIDPVEGVEKQ